MKKGNAITFALGVFAGITLCGPAAQAATEALTAVRSTQPIYVDGVQVSIPSRTFVVQAVIILGIPSKVVLGIMLSPFNLLSSRAAARNSFWAGIRCFQCGRSRRCLCVYRKCADLWGGSFSAPRYGSESLSKNVKWGKQKSAEAGNVTFQYKKLLGYRRGADGKPEIVPEEAETVRRIFRRYLEGASLGDIKNELEFDGIPTSEGVKGWSYQVIQNILTNEKYIGDALLLKTYVTDPISKKVVKNLGDQPMYYVENNHPAIIPKDIFNRAKVEMARRSSKRKVMQKRGKTEQGKYSARYALSELLVCGECGTPYKRCTWARNGKKRIVWRCVSRLEFGTKYCRSSPTLDEDRLHRAIVAALNEYGAIRQEMQEGAMELARMAQDYGVGGSDLLALRRRLDELTAEQALLLDKVLEDMDNPGLNAQMKALAEEKQGILEQIAVLQEKTERQAIQASRRRELEEWLGQQPMMFTEYDDGVTRRLVERITVVDAETIRVKLRDSETEIEGHLC